MKLRNYTSGVPASRSMENIEKLLVDLGCLNISKFYEGKETAGVFFQLPVNNTVVTFKLPCKVDLIYKRMMRGRTNISELSRINIRKQAARTAWKSLAELIQIQCDLILLEQTDVLEAFLPYAFDGKLTLRERVEGNLKLLEAPMEGVEE